LCIAFGFFDRLFTSYFFLSTEAEDSSGEEEAFLSRDSDIDEETEFGVDNDNEGEVNYDVQEVNDRDVVYRLISLALEKGAHLSKKRGLKETSDRLNNNSTLILSCRLHNDTKLLLNYFYYLS
jgi:hypothetical protein